MVRRGMASPIPPETRRAGGLAVGDATQTMMKPASGRITTIILFDRS